MEFDLVYVIEQKKALAADCGNVPQLSSHQLGIIEKVILVLKPIEDITQSIYKEIALLSIVIPFVEEAGQ